MEELSKYSSYIGKKVKYQCTGFLRIIAISEGKLVDIRYNDKTKTVDAIVEEITKPEGGVVTRKQQFPVTDIIQNTRNESRNDNISSTYMKLFKETTCTTKTPLPHDRSFFRIAGRQYDSISIATMKISDDVVWISYTKNNVPLVGKIQGKSSQDRRNDEIVAVVQFDQATNHYPRYLERGDPNQNLVDVNDLVTLSTWTESYCLKPELPSSKSTNDDFWTPSEGDLNTKFRNFFQMSENKKMDSNFTRKASQPGTSTSFVGPNKDVPLKPEIVSTVPQNIPIVTPMVMPTGPQVNYCVAKLPITVCTPNKKPCKIVARTDWTVERLKKEFMEYRRPNHTGPFMLQYKTTVLSDDMLLSSYNIEADSVVQVVFKNDSVIGNQEEIDLSSHKTPNEFKGTLIGNCVAFKNGIVAVQINGIKPGSIMIARPDLENITTGKVNLTCKIKDYGETIFVGVKFRKELPLGTSGIRIEHLDLSKGHCEKCNGRRSLFIPMDKVGSSKDKFFEVQ